MEQIKRNQTTHLIIHGTDDKIWHYKNAGFLLEKIKGSNLITLEGTGHELHVDDWKSIIDGIEKHKRLIKQNNDPLTMYIKNRRNSSKFKALPVLLQSLTENLALRNRLLSYTNRYKAIFE